MKKANEYDKEINTPKYLKKDARKELIYHIKSFTFKDSYIYIAESKDLNKVD